MTTEAETCIAGLVRRYGFAWVMGVALRAAREEAGRLATESEREFERLNRIEKAAGVKEE